MNEICKNGSCTCEQEENFFHVKAQKFSTFEFESSTLLDKDSMGREVFWNDMGRP